jgi:hypothetical protein
MYTGVCTSLPDADDGTACTDGGVAGKCLSGSCGEWGEGWVGTSETHAHCQIPTYLSYGDCRPFGFVLNCEITNWKTLYELPIQVQHMNDGGTCVSMTVAAFLPFSCKLSRW